MQNQGLFFSIVIPARDEELYIWNTLSRLIQLEYPPELYEVIVVENGSSDKTYEEARVFEKENITIFTVNVTGVSSAKNIGIEKSNVYGDWVIFLDADTLLPRDFLKELSSFLHESKNQNYTVGTTAIQPTPRTFMAKAWFAFYNLGHRVFRASYALQIVKRGILTHVHFDERLIMGEDLKLIKDALRYGKFFYFPAKEVYTSTRRFEREGWLRIFFRWVFVAMLPVWLQKRFGYKVVR